MKKWFYKAGAGMAGVLFLASAMALFAPKAVHAVVSTFVTVANTSSNPVPTQSVDNPALQPFQATGTCNSVGQQCSTSDFFIVPAGMTAVVQDASGNCRLLNFGTVSPPPPSGLVLASTSGSCAVANGAVEFTPVFENANTATVDFNGGLATETSGLYTFGRRATLYAASLPGAQGSLSFSTTTATGVLPTTCTVNVSGYYVKNGLGSSPE
ncbi:MAG: hypothetical protein WA855_05395 [Candidatus Acidiferrales bacterium]